MDFFPCRGVLRFRGTPFMADNTPRARYNGNLLLRSHRSGVLNQFLRESDNDEDSGKGNLGDGIAGPDGGPVEPVWL